MAANPNASGIRFYTESFGQIGATDDPGRLVVKIPATVHSKTELLQLLSQQLKFPTYFGWNWDALSDCLRDLHWLEDIREILIVHGAIPFLPGWKKRGIYLQILHDALQSWSSDPNMRFQVLFPETTRSDVQSLLEGH